MKYKVEVTQADIDKANEFRDYYYHLSGCNQLNWKPAGGTYCPIAMALKRQGKTEVFVSWNWARWGGPGTETKLPEVAKRFIEQYDCLEDDSPGSVGPFSFELEVNE